MQPWRTGTAIYMYPECRLNRAWDTEVNLTSSVHSDRASIQVGD